MGTISPAATRAIDARVAEAGIEALDAPVSGGGIGAINGTLSIMVGGKPEIFERIKPLFSCMGKNIVHIGPNSAGQVAKACNQMVMLITLQGLAEAFAFARKNGLDPERVYEALSGGAAQSRILEVLGKLFYIVQYSSLLTFRGIQGGTFSKAAGGSVEIDGNQRGDPLLQDRDAVEAVCDFH